MTRLLVSVRDVGEALAAAGAGADFVDLKDPAAGALGGLPCDRIADIVAALRMRHPAVPISATIGDVPVERGDEIIAGARRVSRCGVDYVKVGLDCTGTPTGGPAAKASHAAALVRRLARCGLAIVPVLLADDGIDAALVRAVLDEHAFPAVMLDTADKRRGSLLQRVAPAALSAFVAQVQAGDCLAGLAGALSADDVPALVALAPDFAGFRSAVCAGDRAGALDPDRVLDLRRRLATRARADGRAPAALGADM